MPNTFDYDLFVIGAGSGGVRAARMSAQYGARVAIAEDRHMGGTCVNIGCVPKKLMAYASCFSEEADDAAAYGWTMGHRQFEWATLIANKNREISRLQTVYTTLLNEAGVLAYDGRATLADAHTVRINGRQVTAGHILVATGSQPHIPEVEGRDLVISSDEVFFLEALPPRVLIVGGGYIAVEFAGIFHGMGAKVTQLYRRELFLRGFDDDLRRTLTDQMIKKGIDLRFNADVLRIEKTPQGLRATLKDGSKLEADTVMYATGRVPNTASIGLETVGVEMTANGAVKVDAYSRSSVEHIHAVGDCTDRMNLTPVAIAEGAALARTLFDHTPTAMEYHNIPSAVFSQPNLGTVGLTEVEARSQFNRVEIYRSSFRAMKHTLPERNEQSMTKLIVDADSRRVVGAHMVGPDAGEIIQGFAVALRCNATKEQFDATIGIHPTTAEEFVTMRHPVEENR